ncbi:UNVERIFIED_CONTAM: Pentatricopeptide repeat-containing protein [Sesamum radiatum]|uniref:Pentatricopeptide repeat-containing protein n=1 Tax=Sesamum radiatum TaxID=300843 RepID=A0AAW2JVG5_SESRA
MEWRQSIKQVLDAQTQSRAQSTFDHKTVILLSHNFERFCQPRLFVQSRQDLFSYSRSFIRIWFLPHFVVDSLSALLLSCTNFKLMSEGKQLHAQVITWSLQKNHTLVPKLVSLYAAFGLLDNAYFIVTDSHVLHPFPWNILISSYVSKGHFEEAIFAYERMAIRQIIPDNFSYTYVLKACAEQSNLDFGKKVHRSINASSLNWNLFVQNALVSMYGKYGDLETARSVFDKMHVTDEVSWNSIISAYASRVSAKRLLCSLKECEQLTWS